MSKATATGNLMYCNAIQLGDADDTTVEIIASSGPSMVVSYPDQPIPLPVDRGNSVARVSIQLMPGLESATSGLGNSASADSAGGVEELQTFLNNFNSELAAESQQHATVRLVESSSITTAANASYTIYETSAPGTATLVYENDTGTLSGNVVSTAAGLQMVDYSNSGLVQDDGSTFTSDNSTAVGDTGHPDVIYLPESLPQHFQLHQDCHFTISGDAASALMGGHAPVSSGQEVRVTISNQQATPQQQADHQQQLLIPIDCSNALVNGNQLPPGSTVLLPVIPTMLANGTVEVRIAGQAIAIPTSVTVSGAHDSSVTSAESLASMVQQPQHQYVVIVGPSSNDSDGARAPMQSSPKKKSPMIKAKASKKQEITPKKETIAPVVSRRSEQRSSISSTEEKSGDESETSDKEKELDAEESETPKKPKGELTSDNQNGTSDSSKRTVFRCEFCDYTNVKKYLLVRHMKSHSEDRPHVCHVCEKRFKANSSLQNHVNTHTGVRPYQCRGCDATFTTSGEMVRHVRYKHTQEKPHKCPHCDYASVELSKLKRHLRSHTGERPYQCRKCEYASPDMYKLKRHMRVHTGEKPYECDICLQRFTQSNSLKAHKLIHTGNKPVYQCQYCASSCGRKTDLKIHIQKLHTSTERPLLCKKCGKSFPDRYSLKQHQRAHEGERMYSCALCTYSAHTQRHLDVHMMVHRCEKPFECPVPSCLHAFRQKTALKRHLETRHGSDAQAQLAAETSGEEATFFQCGHCDKKFRKMEALLKHGQRHRSAEHDIAGDGVLASGKEEEEETSITDQKIAFIESENEDSSDEEEDVHRRDADHLGGSIRLFKCNLCDESFRQLVQFEHHCQLEHIGADDNVNVPNIIYVPNPAAGASLKSMDSAGDSADDVVRHDSGLSTRYDSTVKKEAHGGSSKRPKRKTETQPLESLKLKRVRGAKPGKTTRAQGASATTASSAILRDDPEVQRRKEMENCFGFADMEPANDGAGHEAVESLPVERASTSVDGAHVSFESVDAEGKDAPTKRRSPRKVTV